MGFKVSAGLRVSGLGVGCQFGNPVKGSGLTRRPLSSSFSGLPFWILNINHKKELL